MKLILPNEKYLQQYVDACKEYENSGISHTLLSSKMENILQHFQDVSEGKNLRDGHVPQTSYWLIDGDEFIGQIDIRHFLTPKLEEYGGHIGYSVNLENRIVGTAQKCWNWPCQKQKH